MTDRIEKSIELNAPIERVWRAISDHREFGAWFKAILDQPFEPGADSTGRMTYPGFEHMPWLAKVERVEPPRLLSFRWPPYDHESNEVRVDDPWILVEFRLEPSGAGTRVTVTESGFDALPAELRDKAYRSNEGGWEEQMQNIKAHVES